MATKPSKTTGKKKPYTNPALQLLDAAGWLVAQVADPIPSFLFEKKKKKDAKKKK